MMETFCRLKFLKIKCKCNINIVLIEIKDYVYLVENDDPQLQIKQISQTTSDP